MSELKFDLDNAKKIAQAYSVSTGIYCSVLDGDANYLHCACKNQFCCFISNKHNHKICQSSHKYGCYQAERFGGRYIFFCPLGLVHWISPVTVEGVTCGSLLAGPVLMVQPEEFLFDDYFQKYQYSADEINNLENYLKTLPIISPERVSALSELLFITAQSISDKQHYELLQQYEKNDQQSEISEYIHYIKSLENYNDKLTYPIEKEKELIQLITNGDKAGSQTLLNEILGAIFFTSGGSLEKIKARILELTVVLSRAALEGGADSELIFGLNYKYIDEINRQTSVDDLSQTLSKIMVRFTDCVFNLKQVKHVDIIQKAINYINKNYMKKIALEDVAEHVFLSPSYFSKIFNEELSSNFSKYLNKVRIEQAKRLLLSSSASLIEISNLVGFDDQSYFSKVFKKLTGVTPGKYREARGKER